MTLLDLATIDVANWALLGPLALVVYTVVRRRAWRVDAIEGALAGLLTVGVVKLAGALYAHPRPFVVFHAAPLVAHAADNAFPSDHLAACSLARPGDAEVLGRDGCQQGLRMRMARGREHLGCRPSFDDLAALENDDAFA